MNDRGMIKWQPFNSVINTSNLVEKLEDKRNHIIKPTLSEEQLLEINNKIIAAWQTKSYIRIKYYFKGKLYTEYGIVIYINSALKFIKINNMKISFSQIIDVLFD